MSKMRNIFPENMIRYRDVHFGMSLFFYLIWNFWPGICNNNHWIVLLRERKNFHNFTDLF